jgi:arginyl-tRNA synthetase
MLKNKLENLIKKSAKEIQKKYKLKKLPEFTVEHSRNFRFGDYATNAAMVLGKEAKKNPMEVGNFLIKEIKKDKNFHSEIFKKIEIAKPGFINFTLSSKFLQKNLSEILKQGEKFGSLNLGKGKTVVVDYSAPNIAKPMHAGHLRSTIIGQSLCNIYKFLGYKTISDNHIGDWGTQFGKLIYGYKNWGDQKKILQNPIEEMTKLYVKFHKEAEKNKELEEFARKETKKLQDKNKENVKIWKFLVKESLKEFDKIYKILGIKFDYVLGESFYDSMLEKIVKECLRKKIAGKSEGAIIINLDRYNLPPFLIQKKDGAYLYATTDLAAIKYRLKKFKPDKILYVVSNEQALHFQQLFAALELLGWPKNIEMKHIKFGMVLGENGKKLSTRKGETVSLESLIEKAVKLARKAVEEKNPKLSKTEKQKIAKIVGIGAIKYNDLSQNRMTDIVFDWNKMLNFQGDSAPYLQYTHARIKSILRKLSLFAEGDIRQYRLLIRRSQKEGDDTYRRLQKEIFKNKFATTKLLKNELELSILKQLLFFLETIERAAQEYNPNIIADYLYQLAGRFNLFYQKIPVLKAEKELRLARLNLIFAVATVLKTGLELLGIEAPEKM